MFFVVGALLVGFALYTGWTGAAWTLNGPVRSDEDSTSYWGFILSYLAGALIFAIGGFSAGSSGGIAAVLVCVALVELWSGIQLSKYRGIIRYRDNPGGFFAETTLWLIAGLAAALIGLRA